VSKGGGASNSLAYDPINNVPTVSFGYVGPGRGSQRSIQFARYNPATQSWDIEIVQSGIATVTSLAYGPDGYPSICYADDIDDNNFIDTLKFAHYNGASWDIEIVETGVQGFGRSPTLAYNPVTGYPAIVHVPCDWVRFATWNGASWDVEVIVDILACPRGSLDFSPTGVPYISYAYGQHIKVAYKEGVDWEHEMVEDGPSRGYLMDLKFSPSGYPSLIYTTGAGLKYAIKP
jgi:hypothetical protein